MDVRVFSREDLEEQRRVLQRVLYTLRTYTESEVEQELTEISFLLDE